MHRRRPPCAAGVFATETGGPLTIEDVEPGPVGPRDVVVEIGASGVCHSDLSITNGYVPHAAAVVLGHEGAGTIVEVGAEVPRSKVGDRVIASFVPACGTLLVLPARRSRTSASTRRR